MKDILYRPFRERDRESCLELYNYVYPERVSPEQWDWKNKAGISGHSMIETAWDGERLVGMCNIIPMPVFNGEKEVMGALSDVAITHPDYRFRGIFAEMGERLYRRAINRGIAVVYGFPTDHSVHGFQRRLGWNYIIKSYPLYCWGCYDKANWVDEYVIREVKEVGQEFNLLWRSVTEGMLRRKAALVRNAGYMEWRFIEEPEKQYKIYLAVAENGEPAGYAVIRSDNGGGEEYCQVVDILASCAACFRCLIGYIMKQFGISIMLKITEGSLFYKLALGMGFKKGGKHYYFGNRLLAGTSDWSCDWHYTLSDSC